MLVSNILCPREFRARRYHVKMLTTVFWFGLFHSLAGTANSAKEGMEPQPEPSSPSQPGGARRITPSFARLPLIAREVYDTMCRHEESIRIKLPPEFFDYYITALLWARLLHIKRHSYMPLNEKEQRYLDCFSQRVLILPEPLYKILAMIGTVRSRMFGVEIFLEDHPLPVAMSQGKGGYHAPLLTADNHNLFEEVPSLGVSGDCVMCLAGSRYTWRNFIEPSFPFLPAGTRATANMAGYFGPSITIPEVLCATLMSMFIGAYKFKETIPGTRLNIDLVSYVSQHLLPMKVFRVKDFFISEMSTYGSETQIVETHPLEQLPDGTPMKYIWNLPEMHYWTRVNVKAKTLTYAYPDCITASYYAAFQLHKRDGPYEHWCCVEPDGTRTWSIMQRWIDNKNERRQFPVDLAPLKQFTKEGTCQNQWEETRRYCKEHVIIKTTEKTLFTQL